MKNDILFRCLFCDLSCGDKQSILSHLGGHTRERPNFCKICSKECLTPFTLKQHITLHESVHERFSCVFCDKILASSLGLSLHILRHIGERPFTCAICEHQSIDISDLKHHMKVHAERKFVCQHCKKSFKSEGELRTPVTRVHITRHSLKCSFCDKYFKNKVYLTRHEKEIHSVLKAIRCDICLKVFAGRRNFQRHIKIHQKRKNKVHKYNCLKCGKGFEYLSGLQKHMEIHETPQFECDLCRNLYQTMRILQVHKKYVHKSGGLYSECKICEKKFKYYGGLIHHMTKHTGEALYSCEICKKSFAEKYRLAEHRKTHFPSLRERFPCDICEKVYLKKTSLRTHSKLHVNQNKCGQPKPYSCIFCNKCCTSLRTRNDHVSSHINERIYICKICGSEFKSPKSLRKHCASRC